MEKESKRCKWFEREPGHTSIMRISVGVCLFLGFAVICVGLILFIASFSEGTVDYLTLLKLLPEDYKVSSLKDLADFLQVKTVKPEHIITLITIGAGLIGASLGVKGWQSMSENKYKAGGDDNR